MPGRKKNQKPELKYEVAGLAHDMRTPLSVIKGFLHTLSVPEGDMEEFHGAAKRSLEKVLNLVDKLKCPETETHGQFSRHDIAALIRDAVGSLEFAALERGVSLRYFGPEKLICTVDGDSIERAVTNLILNAIEASNPGNDVRICLAAREDNILIEVSDSGCGIEGSHLPMIFEMGYTRGKNAGSGIGLNICRRVAEDHFGSIDVASKKGEGSVFTLTLPTQANRLPIARNDDIFYKCFGSTIRKKPAYSIEDTLD